LLQPRPPLSRATVSRHVTTSENHFIEEPPGE
jgi:hypothetical protein